MAATRRRRVSGAAGQSVRNAVTVAGSAGSARCPVAAHQSVNSAQIAVYPLGTRDGVTAPLTLLRA